MRISVISLFPEMLDFVRNYGVTGRAVENGRVIIEGINPRKYADEKHYSVDDRPYGGGPGMLMRPGPLQQAIFEAKNRAKGQPRVVLLSPQGKKFDHRKATDFARLKELVLVAGRYEGVDERLIRLEVDEEISIGDFVLSGGEIAAFAVLDAVIRQIPGVLGDPLSLKEESFADDLLECPHYTRPEVFCGRRVPRVLLSGNHEQIRRWRLKQALGRTMERRPDLIKRRQLSTEESALLKEYCEEGSGHSESQ